MIKGRTLILSAEKRYYGKFSKGIWFDHCTVYDPPKEFRTGYGIKIDVCFGHIIRPIGQIWSKHYWNNEELRIQDIPIEEWPKFFGRNLSERIKFLPLDRLKHGAYNPWYAKHWFVLRLPKWIPSMFISVGVGKLFSFYFGCKAYSIDPFSRDVTWTKYIDRERATANDFTGSYIALCPSATFRRTRMT